VGYSGSTHNPFSCIPSTIWSRHWASHAIEHPIRCQFAAMFPPGHWELFKMALDLARAGALVPLNEDEQKVIKKIAKKSESIFP